jgi:hypothetical protein
MPSKSDHSAGDFETENTGGLLAGLLAEEEELDRASLLRLGTWGAASVGAVIAALLLNHSRIESRREQVATADLARQSQQIQSLARESQIETRRLSSAIDTLNSDRDRLFSRVGTLEQGLDSVTGAIARQASSPPAQTVAPPSPKPEAKAETRIEAKVDPKPPAENPASAPVVAAVAATPTTPAVSAVTERQISSPAPQAAAAPSAKADAKSEPKADAKTDTKPSAKTEPQAAAPSPPAVAVGTPVAPAAPVEKPAAIAVAEPVPAPVAPAAPADANPPAVIPATPLVPAKSLLAPPDSAATKLIEPAPRPDAVTSAPLPEVVAAAPSDDAAPDAASAATPKVAVQRTEFGVDVGGASSLNALRALWRGLLKSNKELANLRPIVVVKEGHNGYGTQLRLVAGPLSDAAAAAKICAGLMESRTPCQTTVFDGQSLAMKTEEPPAVTRPAMRYRNGAKRAAADEPAKKPEFSATSWLFGKR